MLQIDELDGSGPFNKCTLDSILEEACWNVNESVRNLNTSIMNFIPGILSPSSDHSISYNVYG